MKQISVNEQNYKVACALSAVEDAVQRLSEAAVAVNSISIDNNLPFMITEDAQNCPGIRPISKASHGDGMVIYRGSLCGCVLQWQVQEEREKAA